MKPLQNKCKLLIIVLFINFLLFLGCSQNKIISKDEQINKDKQEIVADESLKKLEVRLRAISEIGKKKNILAVDNLLLLMNDENDRIREATAWALGEIGDARAVNYLIVGLNDKYAGVRQKCAEALGKLKCKWAVDALIIALEDKELEVKKSAIWALSEIRDKKSFKLLIELSKEKNEDIQKNIFEILLKFDQEQKEISLEDSRNVFEIFILLGDKNPNKRINAIEKIKKIRNPFIIELFFDTLEQEENPDVKIEIILLFGKMKYTHNMEFLNRALFNESEEISIAAIWALGEIGNKQAIKLLIESLATKYSNYLREIERIEKTLKKVKDPKAIEVMIDALKSSNLDIVEVVIKALGEIKDPRAVNPLIEILNNENPNIYNEAAKALGKMKTIDAINPLIKALKDKKIIDKKEILLALGEIGDVQATETLMDFSKKNNSEEVIIALGKIKDNRAVDILINMTTDKNKEIRKRSIEALGEIRDDRATEVIINALKDTNSGITKEAVIALGKIRNSKAVDILIPYLKNQNLVIKQNTILALGETGNKQAIEHLIPLLNDSNIEIYNNVVKSLDKIDNNWRKSKEALSALEKFNDDLKNESLIIREISEMAIIEITGKNTYNLNKSKIKILLNGHIAENMIPYLNKRINILESEIENMYIDSDYSELSDSKIIIIPSAGFEKLDKLSLLKLNKLFRKFTGEGGSILCLTQIFDNEYTALPVPYKDELEVVGYDNDAGYMDRVVLVENYHPILSGIDKTKIDFLCMDGYIKKWPQKSNIILIRNTKRLPGFIIYRYDSGGYIALSSGYSEQAYFEKKDSEEERRIFRDTITWLKNPNLLEEIICPEKVEKKIKLGPINLINNSQETTNYAWIWVYTPDKKIIYDKIFKLKLNPKEKNNEYIDINIKPNGELGIYGIGYKLGVDSTFIYPSVKEDLAQSFAVHKNMKLWELSAIKKDVNAIEPLFKALLDNDPQVRQYSFKTLDSIKSDWRGDIKDSKLIEIINNLKNKNPQIRMITFETLEKIDFTWRNSNELKEVLPDFMIELINKDPDIRKIALEVIEKIEPNWINADIKINSIQEFIAALNNEDTEIRKIASKILVEKKDIRVFNPLLLALGEENVEVRKNIITALRNINQDWEKTDELNKAYQEFINDLKSNNYLIRKRSAIALGEIKDKHAVDLLIDALKDEYSKVRENAAWALGEIKDERAVKPLMKIMFQDKDRDVKKSAAIARSKINKIVNK